MTPKEESILFLDLQEKSRAESRNSRSKKEAQSFVYNAGANAYINNWLANNSLSEMSGGFNYNAFMSDIKNMESSLEYKSYLLSQRDLLLFEISKLNVSGSLKEFLSMKATLENCEFLFMGYHHLSTVYARKYKEDKDFEVDRLLGTFDNEYYSFIKDLPLNNPKLLYTLHYSRLIGSCKSFRPSVDSLYLRVSMHSPNYRNFVSMVDMPEEDIEYANYLIKSADAKNSAEYKSSLKKAYVNYADALLATNSLNKRDVRFANALKRIASSHEADADKLANIAVNLRYNIQKSENYSDSIKKITMVSPSSTEPDSDFGFKGEAWHDKYKSQLSFIRKIDVIKERRKMLSNILGFDSGLFFDLLIARYYTGSFEEQTPLTLDELNYVEDRVSPFFYNYLSNKSAEVEQALLIAKNKQGYTIYSTPEVEDDVLLHEIIKPFEGKVVFVDFWATWCGPCRSAMKQFEESKKMFKNKDVVFVYITDETSPLKTWNNMIATIDGEHYRLTSSQLEYLKRKFQFAGVPSYMIFDKNGYQVYRRTGFDGAEKLSNIINNELAK